MNNLLQSTGVLLAGLVLAVVSNVAMAGASDIVCTTANHPIAETFDGTYVKWETAEFSDTGSIADSNFNPYNSSGLAFFWPNSSAGNAGVASSATGGTWLVLNMGDVVGSGSTFSTSTTGATNWRAGADGYLGFKFACTTAGICYGYAHFTTTGPTGFPAILGDYCWDNGGNAITIPGGPTDPEISVTPASLNATAAAGASDSATLTLTNIGAANLDWNLDMQPARPGIRPNATLLFDQTANVTTMGSVAFLDLDDPVYYESQAADDFEVPAGESWTIEQVFVGGLNQAPSLPTTVANVFIYADDGSGAPGAAIYTEMGASLTDSGGDITVTLATPQALSAGVYWVSVQPERDWFIDGPWYWYQSATTQGAEFHWRNPGDGFGTGCTSWGAATPCLAADDVDLAFALYGESGGGACSSPTVVPWLSVDHDTGTIAPSDSDAVVATFDAAALTPGLYEADLCVHSNDPVNALVVVPVSFTVTAPTTHTVTSSVGTGDGTIAPVGAQAVTDGSTITFTLTPDPGWSIDSVTGSCGGTLAGNDFETDPITGDCDVIANFNMIPVNGTCGVADAGTFTSAPVSDLCAAGTASAVTGAGHPWEWTCAGSAGGSDASCSAQIQTWTLTYQAGANGSITGTAVQTVDDGADGTPVTAAANAGYQFVDWSDGATANPRTDTSVHADLVVTASFAAITHTVTVNVSAAGHGTVSPSGPQMVSDGDTLAFTLTPDPGYQIDHVTSTCGGALVGSVFETGPIFGDCQIEAFFMAVLATPPQMVPTLNRPMLWLLLGLMLGLGLFGVRRMH